MENLEKTLFPRLDSKLHDIFDVIVPRFLHKYSYAMLLISLVILSIFFYFAINYDIQRQRKRDIERGQVPAEYNFRQNLRDLVEEMEEEKKVDASRVNTLLRGFRDGLITGLITGSLTGNHERTLALGITMGIVKSMYDGTRQMLSLS